MVSPLFMQAISKRRSEFLLIIARRIVPRLTNSDDEIVQKFLDSIDHSLMVRPASIRRQLGLFLSAIQWLPVFRYGLPFNRLSNGKKDAVLNWFQDCPFFLFRKGFWGLKTLIFLGYYGQEGLWPEFYYTPSFEGNTKLGK